MHTRITDNIFSIYVELPNSPLKNLNAYLIKGKDENLLIDTGFRLPECMASLTEGLSELGVTMENTDIFLTHMHIDHLGLAEDILAPGRRVFMSRRDIRARREYCAPGYFGVIYEKMLESGYPEDEIQKAPMAVRNDRDMTVLDYTPFDEGEVFSYGGYRLRALATPGHTPGHACLYDREKKVLFLGDHVLFDITPNITHWNWQEFSDPLGEYIKSLVRIRDIDADITLPGHRTISKRLPRRVDEIIEHHALRIREVVQVIERRPGLSAYEISGRVSWSIRYDGKWEHFPRGQKGFAVGEIQAHLEYLLERGRVIKEERGGVYYYYPERP